MTPWQKLDPAWLPPETVMGPWKLKALHGEGAFGLVFRAVRARREHGGWVALKIAHRTRDPRFQREAELLSRVNHPGVPQLLAQGEWQHPGGAAYPFLVMEWIDGLPLYAWAERFNPSSRAVCRVLAQLARALEATHAAEGVHRDVKGSNLLVSPQNGRAVLTDFGAGYYAGAERLTREGLPPGTDAYRSPQAWEFELHRPRNSTDVYAAQPADDVFALGVCAYRLVTGQYLPPVEVREEEQGPGRLEWRGPQSPLELNPRVEPGLSALILRALSERPEDRPNAGELAELLEGTARKLDPRAERPLFESPRVEPSGAKVQAEPQPLTKKGRARVSLPVWVGYAACAVLGGVIAAVAMGWGMKRLRPGSTSEPARAGARAVDLGDTELTVPESSEAVPSGRGVKRPMPEEPLPGQRRAPHCIAPFLTIRGGCWVQSPTEKPPCGGESYEWQGACYVPIFSPPRKPTSEPP